MKIKFTKEFEEKARVAGLDDTYMPDKWREFLSQTKEITPEDFVKRYGHEKKDRTSTRDSKS